MSTAGSSSRRYVVLSLLFGAALALVAWTQTWFTFALSEGVAVSDVAVAGTQCRPLVSALALGLFAGVGALLLAGRVARLLILLAALAMGIAGVWSVVAAALDPIVSSLGPLSNVSGINSVDAVTAAVTRVDVSGWVWACALGFVVVALSALWGALTSLSWRAPTDRFNRPEIAADAPHQHSPQTVAADPWDTLSRGEDPTR